MSLFIFMIVLSILIVVHEWGHFITAKWLGVRVEKFAVGFGRKLYSRKHGDTEFMVCAVPLGGYVKMAGDERQDCHGTPGEFFAKPVGHRALIVFMGPFINFVFAFLCLFLVFATGYPMLLAKVGGVLEGSPAQMAGLESGDQVVRIDLQDIKTFSDMQEYVSSSQGRSLQFLIRRDSQELTKIITPRFSEETNILGQKEKVWIVGIKIPEEITSDDLIYIRYGPVESLGKAFEHLASFVEMTFRALYSVIVGHLPAKEALAGPIGIFDVVRENAALGLANLVIVTALISACLGIFNLFPIPVLDGGHLFLFAVEKLRRRPLPMKVEEGLTKAGFGILLLLFVLVCYNDIVRIGWIDQLNHFWQSIRSTPR